MHSSAKSIDARCDSAERDANYNVTAAVKILVVGQDYVPTVVERYHHTPYGLRTVLNADWTIDTDDPDNDGNYSDYNQTLAHQGGSIDFETRVIKFRHRDLHVSLGLWLERDPLGYVDGGSLYEAVRSSPGAYRDPNGTQASTIEHDCSICGPDISDILLRIAEEVRQKFQALTFDEKWHVGDHLTSIFFRPDKAWDILPLRNSQVKVDGCGTCQCANTVTVNGACWDQGVVNYWLAGVVHRLLEEAVNPDRFHPLRDLHTFPFNLAGDFQNLMSMHTYWVSGDWRGKMLFMDHGYHESLPSAGTDPKASGLRKECKPCSKRPARTGLSWVVGGSYAEIQGDGSLPDRVTR
jgi:RHS repeat-associated protein